MAVESDLDLERRRLTFTATAEVDRATLEAALRAAWADPAFDPTMEVFWDLREGNLLLSKEEAQSLAGLGKELFTPESASAKTAVVAPRDLDFGLVRMVQAYLDELPRRIQVFRTVEEAEAWLEG